jgi:hypothetical protein
MTTGSPPSGPLPLLDSAASSAAPLAALPLALESGLALVLLPSVLMRPGASAESTHRPAES